MFRDGHPRVKYKVPFYLYDRPLYPEYLQGAAFVLTRYINVEIRFYNCGLIASATKIVWSLTNITNNYRCVKYAGIRENTGQRKPLVWYILRNMSLSSKKAIASNFFIKFLQKAFLQNTFGRLLWCLTGYHFFHLSFHVFKSCSIFYFISLAISNNNCLNQCWKSAYLHR